MSTSQITEYAMMKPVMDEAAGPSDAEKGNSDGPADARATLETDAREWGLLGWRGGPGGEPAARLGRSWEAMLAEGWDDKELTPVVLHHADRWLADCEPKAGGEADSEGNNESHRTNSAAHHSPALRLIATLQAAFTN